VVVDLSGITENKEKLIEEENLLKSILNTKFHKVLVSSWFLKSPCHHPLPPLFYPTNLSSTRDIFLVWRHLGFEVIISVPEKKKII